MFLKSVTGRAVELDTLSTQVDLGVGGPVFRLAGSEQPEVRVTRAARTFLGMGRHDISVQGARFVAAGLDGAPPALFRERDSGFLRIVYREVVVRFLAGTPESRRVAILNDKGLAVRRQNRLIPDQVIAYDATGNQVGAAMVEVANEILDYEEVVFATPNFVSEYRRTVMPTVVVAQWHLRNLAKQAGQVKSEDMKAAAAWKSTLGRKEVVVAILDDGVDVDHPNLKPNILWNPDPTDERDTCGRDFSSPTTMTQSTSILARRTSSSRSTSCPATTSTGPPVQVWQRRRVWGPAPLWESPRAVESCR